MPLPVKKLYPEASKVKVFVHWQKQENNIHFALTTLFDHFKAHTCCVR